ncbi:BRCA1-associated RING domain protein 1-like [Macadamia integrifolia]|uniref:BRCA1-associated RING domain protein 1-like n=1 Tax=Macadamia integrifolia TaxID=60698 RepID=UPI001C4FEA8F|nr:BRCA1-associated RING domain protein 1-like [Macadamia integrifolia]
MADSVNSGRFLFLNPWLLHLQKMCLELKCPVCLNLLNRPLLMPCNHILCGSCIPRSTEFGSECPICRLPFVHKDLRPAPHMENIVSIYRSMDEAFGANLLHWVPQSQIDLADVGRAFDQFPATFTAVIDDRSRKEPINTMRMGIFGYPPSSTSSLHSNELVHAPLHQSGDKVEKSRRPDESYVPNNGGAVTKLGQTVGEQRRFHGEGSSTTSLQIQQPRDEQLGVSRAPEEDLNGFTQISHDSPPPFGDGKDSDDDSSARGNQHNVDKFLAKSTLNKEFVDGFVKEMGQGSLTQPGEDHGRESKRMKLNYNPIDSDTDNGTHKSPFLDSENLMFQPKHKNGLSASAVQLSVGPDCSDSKSTVICAFCQSSSLSKRTGPMIHYSNGKELVADEAAQPNIVHVHKKCIEWAPQVYFADDTVHNLEKEISRGAKLKCSHCGLKGAALGCYADSCRKSFHVPCALQIEGCRWDTENFLVLCPTHSSKKFPNEISKLGKRMRGFHASTNQINSSQSINTAGNPEGWVLCGSSLSVKEKNILAKFAKMIGATVAKVWKPNVTHVIAATDEMGACSRTVKVLMAILHGRWVLKMDWIKACLEALQPLPEEPYEVESDIHGCCNGPKKGRLRMMGKAPRLFTGLNFYFFGDFVPSYKECLEDLVLAAGGTLLKTKGMLLPQDVKQATTSTFIVYNHDAPENCTLAEEYMECRFKEAEDFAAEFGYQVLGHTWLLESIAACEIQSPIC